MTTQVQRVQHDMAEAGHKVWLAGLGAFSLVEESAREAFEDLVARGRGLEGRGREALDDLIAKGRKVESASLHRVEDEVERTRERAEHAVSRLEAGVKSTFGRLGLPLRRDVITLSERVEELASKLEAIEGRTPDRVYQVEPEGDGWVVVGDGEAVGGRFGTKSEAVAVARDRAKGATPSRLVILRLDRSVQSETAYGVDA